MTFDPRQILSALTAEQLSQLVDFLSLHDPLMRPKDAAAYLNVPHAQMWKWRRYRSGPAWIVLDEERHVIRYRTSVIRAFAMLREIQTYRLPARGKGCIPAFMRATGQEIVGQLDLPLAA